MFSIITMASSTTNPVPIVSAISDRLSRLKPEKYMMPKLVISDSGSATPAISVARSERRNNSTTSVTSTTLSISVNCTSCTEARMVTVRSLTTVRFTLAGIPLDIDDHRGRALVPAAGAVVLQAIDDDGDVADGDRRAVAVGDDDGLVGVGGGNLIVGGNGIGLLRAVEGPLWSG